MEFLSQIYDIQNLIRLGGLTALVLIVFAETGLFFGFFLPGDSLLLTAGLFAAKGDLDLTLLCVLLTIAAIVGDAVGFWFGHWTGPKLYRRERSFFFRPEHLQHARKFYAEHGGKTIVFARFIPLLRTFAPIVAGIAGMPYRSFVFWNVLGGILWVNSLVLAGYYLGRAIPNLDKYIHVIIVVVIAASFVPVVLHLKSRKPTKIGM